MQAGGSDWPKRFKSAIAFGYFERAFNYRPPRGCDLIIGMIRTLPTVTFVRVIPMILRVQIPASLHVMLIISPHLVAVMATHVQ